MPIAHADINTSEQQIGEVIPFEKTTCPQIVSPNRTYEMRPQNTILLQQSASEKSKLPVGFPHPAQLVKVAIWIEQKPGQVVNTFQLSGG